MIIGYNVEVNSFKKIKYPLISLAYSNPQSLRV
jgi:hypothetical protein